MIEINVDTQGEIQRIIEKFGEAMNPQLLVQQAAVKVLPHMKKRVHEDGKDANGNQIGTYSDAYMKVRTGIYGNTGRITRGPNKGKAKDSGVYTKGKHKGSPRPKYNRTADPKVVLSLTRQMENDMVVIPTEKGWGIGYNNPDNYQKAIWCENTYGKVILTGLTADEEQIAMDSVDEYVTEILNQL